MPTDAPLSTLPPDADLDKRQRHFETIWRGWKPGTPLPHWQSLLPLPGNICPPGFVFLLLKTDIEFRIKSGQPGLLVETYFQHPVLQSGAARMSIEQQVELIRCEYQLRWSCGQRAARKDYLEHFPEHAPYLRDLQPRWNCPNCLHKALPVDESAETAACPYCQARLPLAELFPLELAEATVASQPFPPLITSADTNSHGLDTRKYDLLEPLGHGGMGEVFRSTDPGLGRDLALKVLKSGWQGNREMEQRFMEEARICGSLQHPAIVPVHNLGRLADGRLYFTMKLVRGRTFAQILADVDAARPEHLDIFVQVCQALAYAHSKGVIHRDLKPANIMVGRFGEVQVMDWGLAKVLTRSPKANGGTSAEASEVASLRAAGEELHTSGALGTPEYMAPEQANGEWHRADERIDVFGLGGILCAILTGKPPYSGGDRAEVVRKAQRGDLATAFASLDGCGADMALVDLAKECLSPEVAARPRAAGVVAERMREYLASVQERLRAAEVESAAAQARVEEAVRMATSERWGRRVLMGLAAVVPLLMLGGIVIHIQTEAAMHDQIATACPLVVVQVVDRQLATGCRPILESKGKDQHRPDDAGKRHTARARDEFRQRWEQHWPSVLQDYKVWLIPAKARPDQMLRDQVSLERLREFQQDDTKLEDAQLLLSQGKYNYFAAIRAEESCLSCHRQLQPDLKKNGLLAMIQIEAPVATHTNRVTENRDLLLSMVSVMALLIVAGSYVIVRYVIVKPKV